MDDSPSQKYWEDDVNSLSDTEDELFTKEEAEEMFKTECRLWIEQNQNKLIGTPFSQAYKKPWTKKTSSVDCVPKTCLETPSKKENKKKSK